MRALITGAAGFTGHHVVAHFLEKTDWEIVVLDCLNYASFGWRRLRDAGIYDDPRLLCLATDFSKKLTPGVIQEIGDVDYIVHIGAESIAEDVFLPVQSTPKVGTKVLNFGELWKRLSLHYKPLEKSGVQIIRMKGRQTKVLSFYGGGHWMPIKAMTRHWYEGKMIRLIQNRGIVTATPSHSIYSANLELANPTDNPDLLAIRSINKSKQRKNDIDLEELKVWAAFVTEGSSTFNKANGSYIIEISQKDKRWLEDVLRSFERVYGVSGNIALNKNCNVYRLQISNKELFYKLRKLCGTRANNKKFPHVIFDLNPKLQELFWLLLLEGDGDARGRYTTTSPRLACQIGLLLAMLGREYRVRYRRGTDRWSDSYMIGETDYRNIGQNKKEYEVIDYNGWVYDLEVEKSNNFVCGIGNVVCHNTHVDNSVADALPFVISNVLGTMWMLEFARTLSDLRRFIYFSTDEVFGPADHGRRFNDWDRYNSTNPYAASKAGGEELALAYSNTYDIPMVITHCCNIFGERQHWEKYIPMAVRLILDGDPVLVNTDSTLTKVGSRYYLYGRHVADALLWMLNADLPWCEKFNVTSEREVGNLEMAEMIAMILDKDLVYKLVDPDVGRHSHDLRYDMDGTRLAVSGWSPPEDFEDRLAQTVKWYADNPEWLS